MHTGTALRAPSAGRAKGMEIMGTGGSCVSTLARWLCRTSTDLSAQARSLGDSLGGLVARQASRRSDFVWGVGGRTAGGIFWPKPWHSSVPYTVCKA
eukprot:352204-Chlamydomonas_euryale.AAC.6